MGTLPDALYIGYQKTGTTFFRSYFDHHPDIEFTRRANVFRLAPDQAKIKNYIDSFKRDSRIKCQVDMHEGLANGIILKKGPLAAKKLFTPLEFPDEEDAEQNIDKIADFVHEILPKTKIIMSIRRQTDWLISNWLHFFRRLPPNTNSFNDFLNTFEGRTLLRSGYYHLAIESFQHHFGKDRVHVIPLEYLAADQEDALRTLCRFLGTDYVPFESSNQKRNKGRDSVDIFLLRHFRRVGNSLFARRIYENVRPLKTAIVSKFAHQPVIKEIEETISSFYAESNAISSNLLNIMLADYGYPL